MEKLMYEGKAKKVYELGPNTVILEFKDDVTAGNREKHAIIEGKGELNCSITSKIFNWLEKPKSHFIEKIGPNRILCHKMEIIPIEVIVRNIATGTFCKRYGIEQGREFRDPIVEFCLKDDDLNDPLINDDAIVALNLATNTDLIDMREDALALNDKLSDLFRRIDLTLVDFKVEFGIANNSRLLGPYDRPLLADEICPDTMRLWDKDGNSFDKDLFRNDKGDLVGGYKTIDDLLSTRI